MVDETINEDTAAKPGLSTAKIIIIAVVLTSVLSGGIVATTMMMLGGNEAETAADAKDPKEASTETADADAEAGAGTEGPVQYHQMDPKFVVSFRNQKIARFMQFSLQIMTHDDAVIKEIKQHNPAIRSNLLLLFNNQDAKVMNTREGKQAFLNQIKDEINTSLEALAGISGVEAAYFYSFLIQ